MSDSLRPHGLQPTRLLCPWIFQATVLEWGAIAFSVCGYSMVKSLLVVHPHDYMAACELQLATTAQHGERVQHIASLGKNQSSKLELQFLLNVYHF